MKHISTLIAYSEELRFDAISYIPEIVFLEAMKSEYDIVTKNDTFCNFFQNKMRRSKALQAQLNRECLVDQNV